MSEPLKNPIEGGNIMVQGAKTPHAEAGNAGVVEIAAEKHIAATLKNLLAEGDPVENLVDKIASGEVSPDLYDEYRRAISLLTDAIPVEQAISTLNEYADNGLLSSDMHMALVDMFVERKMKVVPADVAVEKKEKEPKTFKSFLEEARPLAKLESPRVDAEERLQIEFAKHPDFAKFRTEIGVIILQKAFEDTPAARKKAAAEIRIAKVLMGESQRYLLQNLFTVAEHTHRNNGFKMGGTWGPIPSVLNMDRLQIEARANIADITKNIADAEKQVFWKALHGLEQFLSSRNNVEEGIKARIALDWKRDEIKNLARELPEDIKRRSEAPHAREDFVAESERRIAAHEHNLFELLEDTLSSDAVLLLPDAHTKLERALTLSEFIRNGHEEINAVKNGSKNPFEANLGPVSLAEAKQKALAHEVEAQRYADSVVTLHEQAGTATSPKQKTKLAEEIARAERMMREHRERAERLHGNLRLVSLLDEDEKELHI